MRSIVKLDRIMWALAIGAAMSSAFAQRGGTNSGPPAPQQRNEAARSNTPPPVNYVPRASNPAQSPRNYSPRSNAPAATNYVPRDTRPVDTPRNDSPRPNDRGAVEYVPRSTTTQTSQSETTMSSARGPGNWVPRSTNISVQRGGDQSGQGQGQGQDSRHGGQGQGGQDRGHDRGNDQSGRPDSHGSYGHPDSRDSKPQWSPPPAMSVSQFRSEQLRETKDAHTVYGDHARRGYYNYDNSWRNSSLRYPFYVYDPYDTFGFVSPWYYYPSLPGYISPYRCTFVSAGMLPPMFLGVEYPCWRQHSGYAAYQQGYDQGYQDAQTTQPPTQQDSQVPDNRILDGAIDDIVSVFLHDDQRSLDRLINENGNVNIYVDGRYSYSLTTNDFYDLIHDNAHTTQTVDYQIVDVKVQGNTAKVLALHTFKDPWGDEEKVYHTYTLKVGVRSAQITEYGTSVTRPG